MRQNIYGVALSLALVAPAVNINSPAPPLERVVPDFSGRWKFDAAKSIRLASEAQGNTAGILGEDCVITQTTETLTADIVFGALTVQAIYRLDGKPSTNMSPGPPGKPGIPIVSTTQWMGETLHITTKSESELDGVKVPVESVRKIWLTAEGDLAVERRGSPVRVVSNAWSVYEHAPANNVSEKTGRTRN